MSSGNHGRPAPPRAAHSARLLPHWVVALVFLAIITYLLLMEQRAREAGPGVLVLLVWLCLVLHNVMHFDAGHHQEGSRPRAAATREASGEEETSP